jgi:uracil-DNA glycosylase family 4
VTRLDHIEAEIVSCVRCPRLVAWREESAAHPPARYAGQKYWARPVPGFGDPQAGVLIVGLAPAAHGGNRTGRVFTGDRSGDFLFPALFETGFANQPVSVGLGDGLELHDLFVAAVNRCAPPANKPTPQERDNCLPYLVEELRALTQVRVLVCLGAFAWDGALRALSALGHEARPRPAFGHGAQALVGPYVLLGSYHPSQQNTVTG